MEHPFEQKVSILRRRDDGLYELREEVWSILGEGDCTYKPKKLISSTPMGQVYQRVGRAQMGAKVFIPSKVSVLYDPAKFDQGLFILIEGSDEKLDPSVVSYSEDKVEDVRQET